MFIGQDKIKFLLEKENPLIKNLSERELYNPEGAGIDLRVGKISRFTESSKEAYLGVDKRSTLKTELIMELDNNVLSEYILRPGEYVLVTTCEELYMPLNLVGIIRPRGTLFRSGILLATGQVNPGYYGELTFGMFNASHINFKFELGARVAHILFAEVNGEVEQYRGQWNGGRISAPVLEDQV